MDETPIPRPARRFVVVAWVVAVSVGAVVGAGIGLLTQDAGVGIVVGAASGAIIGLSSVVAARRSGRGTIESAPPWTGDAGIRHHGGGAI